MRSPTCVAAVGKGHSHTLAIMMHYIAHMYLAAIVFEIVQAGPVIGLQQAEGCRVFQVVPQVCTEASVIMTWEVVKLLPTEELVRKVDYLRC